VPRNQAPWGGMNIGELRGYVSDLRLGYSNELPSPLFDVFIQDEQWFTIKVDDITDNGHRPASTAAPYRNRTYPPVEPETPLF